MSRTQSPGLSASSSRRRSVSAAGRSAAQNGTSPRGGVAPGPACCPQCGGPVQRGDVSTAVELLRDDRRPQALPHSHHAKSAEQTQETEMAANATLRQLGGLTDQPASLADSTLIMIDCQKAMVRTSRMPA